MVVLTVMSFKLASLIMFVNTNANNELPPTSDISCPSRLRTLVERGYLSWNMVSGCAERVQTTDYCFGCILTWSRGMGLVALRWRPVAFGVLLPLLGKMQQTSKHKQNPKPKTLNP